MDCKSVRYRLPGVAPSTQSEPPGLRSRVMSAPGARPSNPARAVTTRSNCDVTSGNRPTTTGGDALEQQSWILFRSIGSSPASNIDRCLNRFFAHSLRSISGMAPCRPCTYTAAVLELGLKIRSSPSTMLVARLSREATWSISRIARSRSSDWGLSTSMSLA